MKSKTVFLITVAFVYGMTLRNKKNPPKYLVDCNGDGCFCKKISKEKP